MNKEPKYKAVRIPTPLMAQIEERAKRTHRSVTKEVESLLEYVLVTQFEYAAKPAEYKGKQ